MFIHEILFYFIQEILFTKSTPCSFLNTKLFVL